MRVTVGLLIRSISASSLGVSGPCRSTEASAEAEVGVSAVPPLAASCLSRRAVRTIAMRRRVAESVSLAPSTSASLPPMSLALIISLANYIWSPRCGVAAPEICLDAGAGSDQRLPAPSQ